MTASDVPTWTAGAILKGLFAQEQRRHFLETVLQAGPTGVIDPLDSALATQMRFRSSTVRELPLARKASYLEGCVSASALQGALRRALVWFHIEKRSALLGAFLDCWGIPHSRGVPLSSPAEPPTREQALAAIDACTAEFTRQDVAVYFATAGLAMGARWQEVLWPIVPYLVETTAGDPETDHEADGAAPRQAEDASAFTTLDRIIIKSVVAALTGVEGALSIDEARDLVEELVHLNTDRHRTYFHRGFLQTLIGEEPSWAFPEENASRRAWSLVGRAMALARKGDRQAIRTLFQTRRDEFAELMNTGSALAAAALVARPLFDALWDAQAFAEAAQAIDARVAAEAGPPFLRRLLGAARELFLSHRTAEATLVLDLIEHSLQHLSQDELPPREFRYELERRRAQVLRAGGHFGRAEQEFARIAEAYATMVTGEMPADIGLCRGSFKWLSDVQVPRHRDACADMEARLELAGVSAREGLSATRTLRTNAQYILGVRAILRNESDDARTLLEEAYAGMNQRPDLYRDTLPKCRLYYAFAILRSMHEPQFEVAREILQQLGAEQTVGEWPEWLLVEALQVAHVAPSEGVRLAEWIEARFPHLLDEFLHNVELVARSTGLRRALEARSSRKERPIDLRWKDHEILLACARARADVPAMRASLDGLEELTFASPAIRRRFGAFLADQANYDPAWTWEEADLTRAQLLEADGRYEEAGATLASLIHQQLSRGGVDEARALSERLVSYGAACSAFPDVQARLEALGLPDHSPALTEPDALAGGSPIRILFVGGNETQARYDEWIKETLAREYPRVSVTFVHTGWTSNWGTQAEAIRRQVPAHDAVVIMTFVRTELGRTVRDDAGRLKRPWFACTGHGRDWMLRAVVAGARQVADASM